MSSLLFVDLETSSLSDNAAVLEIALIPVINGERHEPFVSYVRPHEGAHIDPGAFKVNGIDPKKIWDFPHHKEVVNEIIKFIDKHETVFKLVAHNANFDTKHLFKLFTRSAQYSNYVTRFSPGHICTVQFAKNVFKDERKKPLNFKLGELCKFFGIKLEKAHTALADIEATVELYEKLEAIQNKPKRNTRTLTYQEQRTKYIALDYLTLNPEGDAYIHTKAMQDPEAMRFILNELWRITQCQEMKYSETQDGAQAGDSWPESWDALSQQLDIEQEV